jgi:hypothetical protein
MKFLSLVLLTITFSAFSDDYANRQFLIGYDNSKIKTPGELLEGIRYVRQRMNGGCMKIAGQSFLETRNGLKDYPNSKKFHGFSVVAFKEEHKDTKACDDVIQKTFQDFKTLGMDVISIGNRLDQKTSVENVTVDVNTLQCGDRTHFPTDDTLLFSGKYFWAFHKDKCKKVQMLLDKASKSGGVLKGILTTRITDRIEFTNTSSGATSDVALYWKLATFQHSDIQIEGVTFEQSDGSWKTLQHD